MEDYYRRLEGYEMRRLPRLDSGGSVSHSGPRELHYMGSSLSSTTQASNASSPPIPGIPTAPARLTGPGSAGSQRRHYSQTRGSLAEVNGLGGGNLLGTNGNSRLQRMGSSTTDSPSPGPVLFISGAGGSKPSAAVPSGALSGSAVALGQLPPAPPPASMRRAGSHGRLEPMHMAPTAVPSVAARMSAQSLLARMGSGDSEQPASVSRSGAAPTRSTSASTLHSSDDNGDCPPGVGGAREDDDDVSQEQRSHFSLRSHHSHHSVRSLGGTSQQMSLSALLPRPGQSPPTDTDWHGYNLQSGGEQRGGGGTGLWRCVHVCHGILGQQIAKKRVEQGVKLFSQNRYHEAVVKWREALKRVQNDSDRFDTLGYLCQAYVHWGKYRELVELSYQQLEIANSSDDHHLRAEAYLNLARGHERLGNLDDALQYCRHSLYSQADYSTRTTGQVHLCLGNIYVTGSNFCKAIEHYELALKVARAVRDIGLELLIFIGMGHVFNILKDYDKGLQLVAKAFELSKSFQLSDTSLRHKQLALLHLVTPLRKLGRMTEAYECCQDALQMALEAGDRPMNARGLCAMGDILRQKSEGQRAYRRYSAALVMLSDMGDQFGRILALDGMAKSISLLCRQKKVCECKPLEAHTRLLDAVTDCGNKMLLRSTHVRLSAIYTSLGDEENARLQQRLAAVLAEEMELICGVCHETLGLEAANSLEALPCSHIFHQICAQELMAKNGDRRKKKRFCPQCRKTLNSRTAFACYDNIRYEGHYPAFIADNSAHIGSGVQQIAL